MILVAKFVEGAWIVVLAIPLTIALLAAVKRYYVRLEARLAVEGPFRIEEAGREVPVAEVAELVPAVGDALR